MAFGAANYKVYAYDLRSPARPLGVIGGPQRAVSYVRFMGGAQLVAASTDSTLRCALRCVVLRRAVHAAPAPERCAG